MRAAILLLALVGCGQVPPVIHPELAGYIRDFSSDCYSYGADLSGLTSMKYVDFADDLEGRKSLVGVCKMGMAVGGYSPYWSIEVERLPSNVLQKALMYHELGHCVLGLDHVPDTIMNTNLLAKDVYSANWAAMVEGLCTRYK